MAKKKAKVIRARRKVGLAGAPIDGSWREFQQYVHYNVDSKEYADTIKSYVKKLYSKRDANAILANPKYNYAISGIAGMCYWITLENAFPDNYANAKEYLKDKFRALIITGKLIVSEKKAAAKVAENKFTITPQMRMAQHALSTVVDELYDIEEDWTKAEGYNLYLQLLRHDIKRFNEIEGWIYEHYNDYIDIPNDKQLKECYAHIKPKDIKKRIEVLEDFIADLEKFKMTRKATRSIRTKKPKAVDKQVEKLKYEKSNAEFKLTSIQTMRMPGSMHIYTFNTKTRQLTVYNSESPNGLSISGTSIKGFDKKTSKVFKLRKPDDIIPDILRKSPKQIEKIVNSIKTKAKVPNGRVNENTIILRAK
jgi:hypothetical protein